MSLDDAVRDIRSYDGPPLTLMEVCGTHTHSIFRHGIRDLLPPSVRLISGPGCPVCVTPASYIDRAAALSLREGHVLCTFGDMLRVPGRSTSLAKARAEGGRVRVLYAPMELISFAEKEPETTFCMAAVGFETTLPIYGLMLEECLRRKIKNVRFLMAAKALMPALHWLCESGPDIGGFLGPGHVSAVIGSNVYKPLCEKYRIPLAVAGFGYEHIVLAIHDLIRQREAGTHEVRNLYPNAVSPEGNPSALALIGKYFVRKPSQWRGLGEIDGSGYSLSPEYERYDAGEEAPFAAASEPEGCLCGRIIAGRAEPSDCPLFGKSCTPWRPVGPCMVSGEGACGIWHKSRKPAPNVILSAAKNLITGEIKKHPVGRERL